MNIPQYLLKLANKDTPEQLDARKTNIRESIEKILVSEKSAGINFMQVRKYVTRYFHKKS